MRPPCQHCGTAFPQSFPLVKGRPVHERFYDKVHRCEQTECWIWMGGLSNGWARTYHNGGSIWANRLSYEIHKGPIPPGLWVLHHCDNGRCVNPEHLYAGTRADNVADMVRRHRVATGPRHGRRTHPRSRGVRLTAESAAQIRTCGHMGGKTLAHAFGVSKQTVCDIKKGRIWKDVEPMPCTHEALGFRK